MSDTTRETAGDMAAPPAVGDAGVGKTGASLPALYEQLGKPEKAALLKQAETDPTVIDLLPKTLSDLWKKHGELSGKVQNAIQRPGTEATKEQWDQFYKELGRPDTPDGYALEKPKLPQGMDYDADFEKWFRQTGHGLGLTQAQVKDLFASYNALATTRHQAQQQADADAQKKDTGDRKAAATQSLESLRKELGDGFVQHAAWVTSATKQFMTPELMALSKETRLENGITLDNDPRWFKAWASIGKAMSDDKIVPPETTTRAPRTDERPRFRFPSMEGNPEFATKKQ